MTSQDSHKCPTCGAALAQPRELPAPEPARKRYMIEYHAPYGVCRDPMFADTADKALEIARSNVAQGALDIGDFDFDENAMRVTKIVISDEDGKQHAAWTDPDSFAQLNADEILGMLEELIGSIEEAKEARSQLDQDIGEIESTAEGAARELNHLRKIGGAE
jgi:hypothetical protein